MKLHRIAHSDGTPLGYMMWCPACGNGHAFYIEAAPHWTFNGNMDAPTFEPSLRAYTTENGQEKTLCHLFLRDGVIEYLGDCPHKFAGQKVPLPDFP